MESRCILASASPRRREILERLGLDFTVFPADVDESSDERDPERLCEELSRRKGEEAIRRLIAMGQDPGDRLVIASDTVVAVDGEILGKPRDEADARRMLRLLSGRSHRVVSGIFLSKGGRSAVSHTVTEVTFAPLSDRDIDRYLASGEPFGKAGAYAVQGLASVWIREIRGDYFSVVGLPVNRLCELYRATFGGDLI